MPQDVYDLRKYHELYKFSSFLFLAIGVILCVFAVSMDLAYCESRGNRNIFSHLLIDTPRISLPILLIFFITFVCFILTRKYKKDLAEALVHQAQA